MVKFEKALTVLLIHVLIFTRKLTSTVFTKKTFLELTYNF
jgi:hypothetical protein